VLDAFLARRLRAVRKPASQRFRRRHGRDTDGVRKIAGRPPDRSSVTARDAPPEPSSASKGRP